MYWNYFRRLCVKLAFFIILYKWLSILYLCKWHAYSSEEHIYVTCMQNYSMLIQLGCFWFNCLSCKLLFMIIFRRTLHFLSKILLIPRKKIYVNLRLAWRKLFVNYVNSTAGATWNAWIPLKFSSTDAKLRLWNVLPSMLELMLILQLLTSY